MNKSNKKAIPELITTGKNLPDNAILEQLAGGQLILAIDGREEIGSSIVHRGIRYCPATLDPELERALHLPDQTAEYGNPGSLLGKIATFIRALGILNSYDCLLAADFVLATWVPEMLPYPPCLNIWGAAGTEKAFLDALYLLCRHPLTLLEPSMSLLSGLPSDLVATLFLRQPGEKALARFFAIAGDQTVLCGGRFLRLFHPCVVFSSLPLSLPALRLAMPAVGTPYLRLSQHQILELSTLGRQLLKYRLSSHRQVAGSRFDAPTFGHEARGIARILGSCLEGDEWWQEQIIAALGDHDEAAKIVLSQGNESAVLEALLVTIHERRTIARVAEITELANGILFARQEKDRLTSKAVGLMLRKALGLGTKRRASGYELKLDSNTCTAIHRSADSHGALSLVKPSADCTFCHDLTPSTPSAVAGEALTVCASRTPRAHVHTTGATTPPLSQPEVVGHD